MKLHWSPRSPFVRKVMIVAIELGLADRIETVRTRVSMTEPNPELMHDNPLSKIPAMVLDDGRVLYDSRVICEYLTMVAGDTRLIPAEPRARMLALRRQALGDGFLDLLVLWRNERDRPEQYRSPAFMNGFERKYEATIRALEAEAAALATGAPAVGEIAIGCALSYIDFRFDYLDWRKGRDALARWHAGFAARPSARATEPVDA